MFLCLQVCDYNVPFGKKNRGMMVCQSFKLLKGADASEEELKLARILGWCIEWVRYLYKQRVNRSGGRRNVMSMEEAYVFICRH